MPAHLILYHNPRCSKSREALALLEARKVKVSIHRYLDNPLSYDELKALASRLDVSPSALVRENEPQWQALALDNRSEEDRLRAIAQYPQLLQRPILDRGDRAILGRPPEALLALLEAAR